MLITFTKTEAQSTWEKTVYVVNVDGVPAGVVSRQEFAGKNLGWHAFDWCGGTLNCRNLRTRKEAAELVRAQYQANRESLHHSFDHRYAKAE